ncbi:MAG: DUF2147 domain-containing protein [Paracoccaceae bacterium]
MKRILTGAAIVIASAASALAADPVEGVWKTEVDDGSYALVTMAPCGDKFCGVISRTFKSEGEYKSENIGKALVWDMVSGSDGAYTSGQIWQPSTGKIYRSKMALSGDVLKVSGCVAGGLICKKQTWTRAE